MPIEPPATTQNHSMKGDAYAVPPLAIGECRQGHRKGTTKNLMSVEKLAWWIVSELYVGYGVVPVSYGKWLTGTNFAL